MLFEGWPSYGGARTAQPSASPCWCHAHARPRPGLPTASPLRRRPCPCLPRSQRDPAARLSAEAYLQEAAASGALPRYLAAPLHPFFAALLHLDTDARAVLVAEQYAPIKAALLQGGDGGGGGGGSPAPTSSASSGGEAGSPAGGGTAAAAARGSDEAESAAGVAGAPGAAGRPPLQETVSGLLADAQASLKQLEGRGGGGGSRGSSQASTPLHTPRTRSAMSSAQEEQAQQQQPGQEASAGAGSQQALAASPQQQQQQQQEPGPSPQQAAGVALPQTPPHVQQAQAAVAAQPHEGMVLLAVLLCTLLRGCRLQEHKARVVGLLCDSAAHCGDETRLQRVLPYLVAATAEPLAAVKCVALRGIARVLAQVRARAAGGAAWRGGCRQMGARRWAGPWHRTAAGRHMLPTCTPASPPGLHTRMLRRCGACPPARPACSATTCCPR